MEKYKLAKRIANFAWDFDPYECMNQYSCIGELIRETLSGLFDKDYVHGLIDWLADIATDCDDTESKLYAAELLTEVKVYG